MISNRTIRVTPTETIYSYLPEILQVIGVRINKQKSRTENNSFRGLIEGSKANEPFIFIRIQIEGKEEPWTHVGGNFIRTIYTTHVTTETYEITQEGHVDSKESMKLLQQFDSKLSTFVWHTAG